MQVSARVGDPRAVLRSPHQELTPCPTVASSHQPTPGSSPVSRVLGLGKHRGNGVGGWTNTTGGRDWVEWGEDAGIESIYHALEARSTLIAHGAL